MSKEKIVQLRNENGNTPKAYKGEGLIKVIVLGSDPSTESNIDIEYAFNLDKNYSYFGDIMSNLVYIFTEKFYSEVGYKERVELKDSVRNQIYVQNLCDDYLEHETDNYLEDEWVKFVSNNGYIEKRKTELDDLFDENIPVLLTSEILLKALLNDDILNDVEESDEFLTYYRSREIIKKEDNKLNRVLIPFSRHKDYCMKFQTKYREVIKEQIMT